jgi:aerobic-type carbon monoxide dehydrogenase small subunit (CoxS/CutS family)
VLGQPKEEEEIIDILSGHLCRCTGYHGITAAFRELAQAAPAEVEKHEGK